MNWLRRGSTPRKQVVSAKHAPRALSVRMILSCDMAVLHCTGHGGGGYGGGGYGGGGYGGGDDYRYHGLVDADAYDDDFS